MRPLPLITRLTDVLHVRKVVVHDRRHPVIIGAHRARRSLQPVMLHLVGLAQRRLIRSWDLPLRALGHYTDLGGRGLLENRRWKLHHRFFGRQVLQASRNTNSGLRVDTLLELHALLVQEH